MRRLAWWIAAAAMFALALWLALRFYDGIGAVAAIMACAYCAGNATTPEPRHE